MNQVYTPSEMQGGLHSYETVFAGDAAFMDWGLVFGWFMADRFPLR